MGGKWGDVFLAAAQEERAMWIQDASAGSQPASDDERIYVEGGKGLESLSAAVFAAMEEKNFFPDYKNRFNFYMITEDSTGSGYRCHAEAWVSEGGMGETKGGFVSWHHSGTNDNQTYSWFFEGLQPMKMSIVEAHERRYMKMAVAEAVACPGGKDIRGNPIPRVGAVIIGSGGDVLATARRGEPPFGAGDHAEFIVLEKKLQTEDLSQATVYTTLEPCTRPVRSGSKIPCAERLIDRKVKRVVIGMLDPNHEVQGRGRRRLQEAGVEVDLFFQDLEKQILDANKEFTNEFPLDPTRGSFFERIKNFFSP